MEISKLDKNFKIINEKSNGILINVPSSKVSLFGLLYNQQDGFYRMNQEVANSISQGITYLNFHTSGGRISFSTNSKTLAIHVAFKNLEKMYHMSSLAQAGFSLCEIINGKETHIHSFSFNLDSTSGYISIAPKRKRKKIRRYIIHFPLYNFVQSLSLEIDKDSIIEPFNPYMNLPPIIYYGSSITQGACSSRSDHSYQGFICKWLPIDYINLGFSGNCKGELDMARYISSLSSSVIVMDYDHNTPSVEYLKNTHLPFYLELRKNHPFTPIILISAPSYHYDPKGLIKRKEVIIDTYKYALKDGDKNIYSLMVLKYILKTSHMNVL